MMRKRGNSRPGARGCAADEASRERRLRTLAERMQPRGQARLRLPWRCAAQLRRSLAEAGALEVEGDEALRRLRMDAGRIEDCLRQARAEGGARVPAVGGKERTALLAGDAQKDFDGKSARVLLLARELIEGGERLLTKEALLREVALFDCARPLTIRELRLLPVALRIALCEALRRVAADVVEAARERRAAARWVRGGGEERVPRGAGAAFFECALRLCAELERPKLCAPLERAIRRRGWSREQIALQAQREDAGNCVRLENLMRFWHLLGALDWNKCFEELCPVEQELREDPSGVYPAMDDASRGRVLGEVEALARHARVAEFALARRAHLAAERAMEVHGKEDPRATVCWYLYEDAGRAALCRKLGVRAPERMVPDPSGRRSVALVCGLTALALAACLWGIGAPALMVCALPLAWASAWRVLGRVYPKVVKPHALLKLKLDRVPRGARTLVALPVLLSGEERARDMLARMETLGCLERDENIDFLLLGDFRDSDKEAEPEDESILRAAREGVARLNAAAGREKYFYLHRPRTLRARDARWMGEDRKRGALVALNRLLLDEAGAAEAFSAEGSRAGALCGRYRYVVTLDADTEYLPGTLQELIGAMLHPLNRRRGAFSAQGEAARAAKGTAARKDSARGDRTAQGLRARGYAILQPDMRLTAEAAGNAWVELTAGAGGVDGYPTSVSDFYQDMTGRGCFAGKGIYDVRAFAKATEGALGGDVLSHDLIEGILAGAGLLNDVRFYDGCPSELGGELRRLHRWTRGDWQLLPLLFGKLKLCAADRMKLIGNLLRSLYAPALLALLLLAIWLDAPGAFALGLAVNFLEPMLNLLCNRNREGRKCWRAALLQLAVLPATAFCQADAILRTLWRLAVTHKHLMEWVPAADVSGSDGRARLPGRVAALLALPGLARGAWIVPALGVAMLFWVGADWAGDLSRQRSGARGPLSPEQGAQLTELARRTWRFFEEFVPEDGAGLPPDNVQLDPWTGPAARTSPTNVGLYLMSCLAARELGFLSDEAMRARMRTTAATLEGLEKWRGQLYNWYDTQTLHPLRPRYVSAVDSGNLAGALLLCAHATRGEDPALSARLRALAEGMDLAALYDSERELFRIGMDAESGRLSESHYDLYASEARILSFAAMMLGQIPVKHWTRLNRTQVRVGKGRALLSWSGTMFEYLMPELILRSPANTLAGRSREGVAACQIRHGRRTGRPWGVSESGFYAFDGQLNYQYRAFGLPELALSGEAEAGVVAPYAAALVLCCEPRAAAENLHRMCELGWTDEYGLFEAADYARRRTHGAHRAGVGAQGESLSKRRNERKSGAHGSDESLTEHGSGEAETARKSGDSSLVRGSESRLSERELQDVTPCVSSSKRKDGRARHKPSEAPLLVRSHMAHHQGMTLCAICNALRGDALARIFMDIPEARALRLLLQEKPGERPARRGKAEEMSVRRSEPEEASYFRGGRAKRMAVDTHLLHGARTTALVTARGAAFAWSEDLQLNRFGGDLTDLHEGMYVHVEDARSGACTVLGRSARAGFDAGYARFRESFDGLRVELKLCVSPEDGALYQLVEIENPGSEAREMYVSGCLAVALAPERDMRAHPVFQNLFVEGAQLFPGAVALRRRPRSPGAQLPTLIYLVSGGESPRSELRLDALVGRTGSLGLPGGLRWEDARSEPSSRARKRRADGRGAKESSRASMQIRPEATSRRGEAEELKRTVSATSSGERSEGAYALDFVQDHKSAASSEERDEGSPDSREALLNPCAALRVRVRIASGEVCKLHFALSLAPEDACRERAAWLRSQEAASRALCLATAQARTLLIHAGLDAQRFGLYQRAAALLFDPKLRAATTGAACAPADRRALWSAGISGELPVLLVELTEEGDLACAREGVRLHGFYRSMGVRTELVLLDARGGDYRHNAHAELGALLAVSHLGDSTQDAGGAHVLDSSELDEATRAALRRTAALRLGSGGDPLNQLRDAEQALKLRPGEEFRPMRPAVLPAPENLEGFNGIGGYRDGAYHILLRAAPHHRHRAKDGGAHRAGT